MTLRQLLLVLAFAWTAWPARAAGEAGDASAMFRQAGEAYRNREYDRALRLYRSLSEQVRHPVVLYNWGNAAYKAGRLGEAILALERAHRIAPRDADIRANLSFMRVRVKDAIPDEELDIVTRALGAMLDRVSTNELAVAAAVLLWLCAGIAALSIVNRRREREGPLRWALLVGCLLLLAVMAPCGVKLYQQDGVREAIVLAPKVEVLSGPAADEMKRFTLHEGTRVRILRAWDRWVQLAMANGESGWALAEHLGTI